jgi:uncharacterized membrane protein YkoI
MRKRSWIWILVSIFVIIIVFYVSWQKFGPINAKADILSKHEAQNLVQERYQGTIKQIKLTDNQFHIEFEKQDIVYIIKLDALSGKVLSFTQKGTKSPPPIQPEELLSDDEIKKIILSAVNGTITSFEKVENEDETIYKAVVKEKNKQTSLTVDAVTGKILSSTTTTINQPPKRLTATEAREIAKKQVNGVVDHISLETSGQQTYYLVEMKTQDGREAIVQIHAITGNVMSVTWDDHSNDDDSKNDDSKNHSKDDDLKNDDSKNRSKDDKKEDDD